MSKKTIGIVGFGYTGFQITPSCQGCTNEHLGIECSHFDWCVNNDYCYYVKGDKNNA